MEKKTLYKTVITIEVLSDEPIPEGMGISNILSECDDGDYSGISDFNRNKKVIGIDAINECKKQGTDVDFFGMDEEGNDYYSDDGYDEF